MNDHGIILQYIQALGFPICVSITLAYALYKIGGRLLDSFFAHLESINPRLDRIANAVESTNTHIKNWPSDLNKAITDAVKEEVSRQLEKIGCKLTQTELNVLFRAMENKK